MRYFRLTFLLLTMMASSCSNDTTDTLTELKTYKTTFGESHQRQVRKIASELSVDPLFKKFYDRLSNFSKLPKNRDLIQYFGKEVDFKKLNEEGQLDLLEALGFLNREEAYNFDNRNLTSLEKLFKKYNLYGLTTSDLTSVFHLVFSPRDEQPPKGTTSCQSRFTSCENSAYTLYALEITGCAVAAGASGGASFWCGGCLGYVVGSLCVSAAAVSLNSSLNQCQWSYDDCK